MAESKSKPEAKTKKTETSKIENSFEYSLAKEQTVVFLWQSVMQDYIYKEKDMSAFYEQLKDLAGERSVFFENWFRAFTAAAEFDFDSAAVFYKKAFENIEKAEEYTGRFVQQGFTFFMYTEDKTTALKIWDYGVSKKMTAPLNEGFFKTFSAKEQFWTQFPPVMFKDLKKAEEKAVKDYSKKSSDPLLAALESADYIKFKTIAECYDLDKISFNGVSPLYYAVQHKQTIIQGSEEYARSMTAFRVNQLLSSLDFSHASKEQYEEALLKIRLSMKQTYLDSRLGKIMFYAWYCHDEEIPEKISQMEKIIEFIVSSQKDPDSFKMNSGSGMTNTALYLAAETDDSKTASLLLSKGASPDKVLGKAETSFQKKDGTTVKTSIPNTFIYRLINFKSWNTLKMYLTDFSEKAKPSMTEKTKQTDITPLVYFIMTLIYSAKDEKEFAQNKKTADSFLQLFINAGASLEQNTAFGSAKELLGM